MTRVRKRSLTRRLFIAGVDEAGRGPLAGPVTAGCVCLPADYFNPAIADSKSLDPELRESLAAEIEKVALAWAVVSVGPRRIETVNIRNATKVAMCTAMRRVGGRLSTRFRGSEAYYIVDGNMTLGNDFRHEPIVSGDDRCFVISAASILAKVHRDRLMRLLDFRYPGYGFAGHKGYATEAHRRAIRELGPSIVHRRTFSGVLEYLPETSIFRRRQIDLQQSLQFGDDSFVELPCEDDGELQLAAMEAASVTAEAVIAAEGSALAVHVQVARSIGTGSEGGSVLLGRSVGGESAGPLKGRAAKSGIGKGSDGLRGAAGRRSSSRKSTEEGTAGERSVTEHGGARRAK